MSMDLIYEFVEGASVSTATEKWVNEVNKSPELITALIACAVTTKSVIRSKGIEPILINSGLAGDDGLNFSLCRIMGNMLLEANTFSISAKITRKLGGKSMLSATKMKETSKKIYQEQVSLGKYDNIREHMKHFILDPALIPDELKIISTDE